MPSSKGSSIISTSIWLLTICCSYISTSCTCAICESTISFWTCRRRQISYMETSAPLTAWRYRSRKITSFLYTCWMRSRFLKTRAPSLSGSSSSSMSSPRMSLMRKKYFWGMERMQSRETLSSILRKWAWKSLAMAGSGFIASDLCSISLSMPATIDRASSFFLSMICGKRLYAGLYIG